MLFLSFQGTRWGTIALVVLVLSILFGVLLSQREQDTRQHAQAANTSFVFTAAGDHGINRSAMKSIDLVAGSGSQFYLALGDLSYQLGGEKNWCSTFKSRFNDVEVLAGNHDTGESTGGDINKYVQYCPFTLPSLTGDYGKQYYFDYPLSSTPLARFIMIAPGVEGSLNVDYNVGGAGYTFTQNAIDDAQANQIKWIVVGTHKNCITSGVKTCEIETDIMDLLINEKVDLILQSHDHNYQRSHALSCVTIDTYNSGCVADDGSDGVYVKGKGSVIIINGGFGHSLYAVNTEDAEAGYFAKLDSTTFGIMKYAVSSTELKAQYIASNAGDFADSFTITDATVSR